MAYYVARNIEVSIRSALARGKSIMLLGPRQTGKTTLVREHIKPDIEYTFARISVRQRYEKNPVLLERELDEKIKAYATPPLIFIDEVQKIPEILDVVQDLIDSKKAQFILSGSSARKLKHGHDLNLLPGRVVNLTMAPLSFAECPEPKPSLETLILYGSLPAILLEPDLTARETDLQSYVRTYLEDEIRAEAAVRNIGSFTRFLEIAAGEAGHQINFTKLSQVIGVAGTTIANYFQILEDCLIVTKIDPVTESSTKRRLIHAPKYLFFDLGIRRACANEGTRLPLKLCGNLLEQYVGNELLRQIPTQSKLRYWRDSAGPEIDYVIEANQHYIPIEVKWTDAPRQHDAKHLIKFLNEYPNTSQGFIICQTPHPFKITDNILALPWQEIGAIMQVVNKYY